MLKMKVQGASAARTRLKLGSWHSIDGEEQYDQHYRLDTLNILSYALDMCSIENLLLLLGHDACFGR
jgi:hypothetical protein